MKTAKKDILELGADLAAGRQPRRWAPTSPLGANPAVSASAIVYIIYQNISINFNNNKIYTIIAALLTLLLLLLAQVHIRDGLHRPSPPLQMPKSERIRKRRVQPDAFLLVVIKLIVLSRATA